MVRASCSDIKGLEWQDIVFKYPDIYNYLVDGLHCLWSSMDLAFLPPWLTEGKVISVQVAAYPHGTDFKFTEKKSLEVKQPRYSVS